MKVCPGEHCGWLFYDASRNRSVTGESRGCAGTSCWSAYQTTYAADQEVYATVTQLAAAPAYHPTFVIRGLSGLSLAPG